MPRRKKNSIAIPASNKRLIHIFHDLEKYGKACFYYNENKDWQRLSSEIGRMREKLDDKSLLLPPATNRYLNVGLIQIANNVSILCVKKSDSIHYNLFFKEYRIF